MSIDPGPPRGPETGEGIGHGIRRCRWNLPAGGHREAGKAATKERRPLCEACLPRSDRASRYTAKQAIRRLGARSPCRCHQGSANGIGTVEAANEDELGQHRTAEATGRTAHASDRHPMDHPFVADLSTVGAVKAHGPIARYAARTRQGDPVPETGVFIHTQTEGEDGGDGWFYRVFRVPARSPSQNSVAERGGFISR